MEDGVIVANPPYGERLSDQASVRELYKQMGQVFKPLTDWSKYILTADLEFEHFYGQKALNNFIQPRMRKNQILICHLFFD